MTNEDETAAGAPRRFRQREGFFGRTRGKTLTERQARLVDELLPRLSVDVSRPAPADLAALFDAPVSGVRVEIGFGGGEHLRSMADRFPDTGFIGIEPFRNGMAKMLVALEEEPRPNVRLSEEDALVVLDWLPEGSIAGLDLLYPDPWRKKRHWKRRFVSSANLDRIARALRPGAPFRFASDIDTYVNWTLRHCAAHPAFEWTAERASDWHDPYAGWPGTRYEEKAIREGRRPAYLSFRRL